MCFLCQASKQPLIRGILKLQRYVALAEALCEWAVCSGAASPSTPADTCRSPRPTRVVPRCRCRRCLGRAQPPRQWPHLLPPDLPTSTCICSWTLDKFWLQNNNKRCPRLHPPPSRNRVVLLHRAAELRSSSGAGPAPCARRVLSVLSLSWNILFTGLTAVQPADPQLNRRG